TVHRFDRNTGHRPPSRISAPHHAVGNGNIVQSALGLGPKFEVAARSAKDAVRHYQMFGGAQFSKRHAGLRADGIVPDIDVAVGNSHIMAAIQIDAVGKAVDKPYSFDFNVVRTKKADVVVRGVTNSDSSDCDPLRSPNADWLRAAAAHAIAVDFARTLNGDVAYAITGKQRIVKVRRFGVVPGGW